MMEGITAEAIAGTLELDKLIVLYDSNSLPLRRNQHSI